MSVSYTAGTVLPNPPKPTSPGRSSEPGEVISTLTPTLTWEESSGGAEYYALAISKYPYGQSYIIYNPQKVYRNSHQVPSGPLQWDTKYRWNMQAYKNGQWSSVSTTLYFQTKTIDNYPVVTSFDVQPKSITIGNSVNISYTVSDDIGLKQVALWRARDGNNNNNPEDNEWEQIGSPRLLSGKGPVSGSFTDTPSSTGTYWYGVHVVDNSGDPEHWNDEQNSRTGGSPGDFGPVKVTVGSKITVNWTTPPPSTLTSGQSFTVTWSISGGTKVSHTNVHFDTISDLSPNTCSSRASCQSTTIQTGSPGYFSTVITAPTVTTQTLYYFAAHATVDGTDILTSPSFSVTINPPCGPPTSTPIPLTVGGSEVKGCIGKGQVQVYKLSAELDQNYSIVLVPKMGDPDLYLSSSESCINQVPNPVGCNFKQSTNPLLTQESINVTATLTGIYYVAVYGSKDSSYTIRVVASPLARLDASNNAPVSGEKVSLTGKNSLGSSSSCNIVSYAWDFGDETTGNGMNVEHTFISSAGTTSFIVKLTVTDCIGRTDSKTMTITVTGKASGINNQQSFSDDPVNLATGNYTYEHIDLRIPSRGLPFEFKRVYNSKDSQFNGVPLGYGWTHSYNIKLIIDDFGNVVILFGDGHSEVHIKNADGTYSSEPGVFNILKDNGDGTFTLTTKEQVKYKFNKQGQLATIADKNGNTLTFSYDAFGNLFLITDTVGRSIQFTYDENSRLIQITDPIGRTVTFGYDNNGDLTTATDPNSGVTQYTYDAFHQIVKIIDPRGNAPVSLVYDDQNRVVKSQKDALGNETRFEYDFETRVTTVTDALGNKTYYFHDEKLRITSIKDSQENIQEFEYDENNNRTRVKDKNGNITIYSYDAMGNVTSKVAPLLNQTAITYDNLNNPIERTDALKYTTYFEYDAKGNLIKTTDPLGNVTIIEYDIYGQPIKVTDARGNTTTNKYDAEGNLIEILDAFDKKTSYTYDGVGRRLTVTDALVRTTYYKYDNNNNLLEAKDPSKYITTYTYDKNNNRLTTKDPMGNTTSYTYDEKDRLIIIKDPLNNTISYTYDALDRKTSEKDKRGNLTKYENDILGNLISVEDALEGITTYTYDANGNKLTETNPLGQTTSYTYDALNRVIKVTDPLGNTTTNTYDALGRVIKITNAKEQATNFEYDAMGRLLKVTDANEGMVEYTYDKNGNRLSMKDPNGNTTWYAYDKLNRLIKKEEPLGNIYRYTYDEVGNRISLTDANDNTINYSYDANDRLITITYPDSSSVTFTYDKNGNRIKMVDSLGTSTYTYDVLNRMTSYTDPFNNTVRYEYDANGNRTSIIYPDNKAVTYTYNALNRLISVTDWLTNTTNYTYDVAGNLTKILNPNNTLATYTYDDASRLTNLLNTKSDSTVISSYSYTLDTIGNHTSVVKDEPLLPVFTNKNITYTYDKENRLINAGGTAYTHDANGNFTAKGTDTFTYDYNDRLIQSNIGGMAAQYSYDGLGNRLKKINAGVTTRYVLDINGSLSNVLAEIDDSGTITAYYVYGLGLISKILPDGTTYYYHYDSRGSTVALSDVSGNLTDKYAYDTFGNLVNSKGTTKNPFKYVGRYGVIEEGNGLNYIRARYYDPEIGKFITKDPRTGNDRDGQSLNRYVYALNNPVRLIDISGFSALEGTVEQNISGSSDSLHSEMVDDEYKKKLKKLLLENAIAWEQARLASDLYLIELDKWINIFTGVKEAAQTSFGFLIGGPVGAAPRLLKQSSTLSDIAGGPEELTKTLRTASYAVEVGTGIYNANKIISNISKLGGITRTGQLTLGTALFRTVEVRLRLIYSGYKIGSGLTNLFNDLFK